MHTVLTIVQTTVCIVVMVIGCLIPKVASAEEVMWNVEVDFSVEDTLTRLSPS